MPSKKSCKRISKTLRAPAPRKNGVSFLRAKMAEDTARELKDCWLNKWQKMEKLLLIKNIKWPPNCGGEKTKPNPEKCLKKLPKTNQPLMPIFSLEKNWEALNRTL